MGARGENGETGGGRNNVEFYEAVPRRQARAVWRMYAWTRARAHYEAVPRRQARAAWRMYAWTRAREHYEAALRRQARAASATSTGGLAHVCVVARARAHGACSACTRVWTCTSVHLAHAHTRWHHKPHAQQPNACARKINRVCEIR